MKPKNLLKLFVVIFISVIKIDIFLCLPDNLDFEIETTKDFINSKNIIIDLENKFNTNQNYYIKIK